MCFVVAQYMSYVVTSLCVLWYSCYDVITTSRSCRWRCDDDHDDDTVWRRLDDGWRHQQQPCDVISGVVAKHRRHDSDSQSTVEYNGHHSAQLADAASASTSSSSSSSARCVLQGDLHSLRKESDDVRQNGDSMNVKTEERIESIIVNTRVMRWDGRAS